MGIINIPANYYEEFDADYSLDVPAEGYGGWKKITLPLNTDTTALVIMHAWDCGTYEQYPGWHRAVEYIPRAAEIGRTVFPGLLRTVRDSGMQVFHVVAGDNGYYKKHEGYRFTQSLLTGCNETKEKVREDEVYRKLSEFKQNLGCHNKEDISRGFENVDFMPEARPAGAEGIAEDESQLFALCRHFGINHLIYIGFAIDWCLLLSSGGMKEMKERGLICSTIRQAVTAVENRETGRNQICKGIGLWRVALLFGFVYELKDFVKSLEGGLWPD